MNYHYLGAGSSVIKVGSFVKMVRRGLHFCSGEENQDGLKKISA
jgi:hypothetical protein